MRNNTHPSDSLQHSESMQHHGFGMQGVEQKESLSSWREMEGVGKWKEPVWCNNKDFQWAKERQTKWFISQNGTRITRNFQRIIEYQEGHSTGIPIFSINYEPRVIEKSESLLSYLETWTKRVDYKYIRPLSLCKQKNNQVIIHAFNIKKLMTKKQRFKQTSRRFAPSMKTNSCNSAKKTIELD